MKSTESHRIIKSTGWWNCKVVKLQNCTTRRHIHTGNHKEIINNYSVVESSCKVMRIRSHKSCERSHIELQKEMVLSKKRCIS